MESISSNLSKNMFSSEQYMSKANYKSFKHCDIQRTNNYIKTPYWRELGEVPQIGCVDEPTYHYNSYQLFCLTTRLYSTVYKLFDRSVVIYFEGIKEESRVQLTVVLKRLIPKTIRDNGSEEVIQLTLQQNQTIKEKILEITSVDPEYCLIDRNELYHSSYGTVTIRLSDKPLKILGNITHDHVTANKPDDLYYLPQSIYDRTTETVKQYPKSWFNKMLAYIDLDSRYNPFITEEGIWLSFNPKSNFQIAYNQTVEFILNNIDRYYQRGYIWAPNAWKFALNWKLERVDVQDRIARLWRPTWTDNRFAINPVDFLLHILNQKSETKTITFTLSDNLVRQHYIVKNLLDNNKEFLVDNDQIKVEVNDLDDTQDVASLIEQADNTANGKVALFVVPRLSWVLLIQDVLLAENTKEDNIVVWTSTDIIEPYTVSVLISKQLEGKAYQDYITEKVKIRLAEIEKANPGHSPHDLIESSI